MTVKKLLLAEDDIDDVFLFREFLKERKDIHLLPVAENGVVLIELLNTLSDEDIPHIIILDQNMPKMNGIQTLQFLKEDNRYAGIPVMVYSTYTDQRLVDICTNVGALQVVSKPLTKDGYIEMIDGFLTIAGNS